MPEAGTPSDLPGANVTHSLPSVAVYLPSPRALWGCWFSFATDYRGHLLLFHYNLPYQHCLLDKAAPISSQSWRLDSRLSLRSHLFVGYMLLGYPFANCEFLTVRRCLQLGFSSSFSPPRYGTSTGPCW